MEHRESTFGPPRIPTDCYLWDMRTLMLALAWMALLFACGARSELRSTSFEEIVCPLVGYHTRPGVPVSVSVQVPWRARGLVRWQIVSAPGGAAPSLSPEGDNRAVFVATTEGVYLVRASIPVAEDGGYPDGWDSSTGSTDRYSCVIAVTVAALAPQVRCPEDITTTPLTTVRLTATVTSDRTIVSREWTLVDAPASSGRNEPMPRNELTTEFRPDVAGDYRLQFVARDAAGQEGRCQVTIHAVPREALRVEMFWNPPDRSCDRPGAPPRPACDASDVDLHLLHASRGRWASSPDDCFYANCVRGGLEWDAPGPEDNPRLDIDDVEGFGPENINVDRAGSSSYRIGVHFYAGDGRSEAEVYVLVYCGTSTPVHRFGPVTLRARGSPSENDFWIVADVVMQPSGCTVQPIQRAGREWIVTQAEATRDPGPPPPSP